MSAVAWWVSLSAIAVINIAAWTYTASSGDSLLNAQLVLSGLYVFGCAYRSFLPVYDIPRICMVDSFASSVLVGRSVATIAELAFGAQWAVYLHGSELEPVRIVSYLIVPLLVIAEICSWHAVLTTSNRGHIFENSLWGVSAALIVASLVATAAQGLATESLMFAIWILGGALYVLYIFIVDVPTYVARWKADEAQRRKYLSIPQGFADLSRRRVFSRRWEDWRGEVVWMTLYFSFGVWVSISLIRAA